VHTSNRATVQSAKDFINLR